MTINEQLHNSATHAVGPDANCPVCSNLAAKPAHTNRDIYSDKTQSLFKRVEAFVSDHASDASCDPVEALGDVLAELRRYADSCGIEFYTALDDSYSQYLEEKSLGKPKG